MNNWWEPSCPIVCHQLELVYASHCKKRHDLVKRKLNSIVKEQKIKIRQLPILGLEFKVESEQLPMPNQFVWFCWILKIRQLPVLGLKFEVKSQKWFPLQLRHVFVCGVHQGLFYSETPVLAETPLVEETPTKWEKSSDRCWPVYHMPYGEAVRSGKAAELHRFDCCLLLSRAWCCKLT